MQTYNEGKGNDGLQELHAELERRFGPDTAKDIVVQIKLAKSSTKTPDYLTVKACSEVLELFRGEAKAVLRQLKNQPRQWGVDETNISYLGQRRLELEFRRVYRLYWTSMKQYYSLHQRAMADYRHKISSFRRSSTSEGLAQAA